MHKDNLKIYDPHFNLIDIPLIYLTHIQVHEKALTAYVCVLSLRIIVYLHISLSDTKEEMKLLLKAIKVFSRISRLTSWDVKFMDQ